jgi:hypothetical protein
MKHALIFPALLLAMTVVTAHAEPKCAYSETSQTYQQYTHCSTPEQKAAAFKSFCKDMDRVKGAYDERPACANLLHPYMEKTGDCAAFTEGQTVTLHGQIFQGKMLAGEGEGGAWEPERKYMAINLYPEICLSGDDHRYSMLEVAIPENWLGHDVVIVGRMDGCLDGYCIDVKSIRDEK